MGEGTRVVCRWGKGRRTKKSARFGRHPCVCMRACAYVLVCVYTRLSTDSPMFQSIFNHYIVYV